ncbi:MAG: tRNA (adenosine(37)-N6)-dimethylallyltransferase MiaA [Candidatus Melainabacteria bacterium]|nr:tRNA (adenosine(37)-N6)-dimethylallyltransferase MiaA [Candidatus Melainabacteria bacterium]
MDAVSEKPLVVAIVGSTATGKTALALALAQYLKPWLSSMAVISADSQQVYRHLEWGTAKPSQMERSALPHYLLDVAEPTEAYSVARYRDAAQQQLLTLMNHNTLPLVVGGTGFYVRALLEVGGMAPVAPDKELRRRLLAEALAEGSVALHERLKQLDPVRAGQLHPNDQVRIVRALEIIEQTGQPVPQVPLFQPNPQWRIVWVGLTVANAEWLRQRINDRVDAMLRAGWLQEVEALLERYGPEAHALKVAHGYPEWMAYVQGQRGFDDALAQVRLNIHQYARRQRTWFRRHSAIQWFQVDCQPLETIATQVGQQILGHLGLGPLQPELPVTS